MARGKDNPALGVRKSSWYAQTIGADDAYCHVLTHNPMYRGHGPGLVTAWQRREPYGLKELSGVIPGRWRTPSVPKTTIGYNWSLFKAGMKWAGGAVQLEFNLQAQDGSAFRKSGAESLLAPWRQHRAGAC